MCAWKSSSKIQIQCSPRKELFFVLHNANDSADQGTLWNILEKVSEWHVWDTDIKGVDFENQSPPFLQNGVKGMLHMKMNRSFPFTFQNIEQDRHVEYLTALPGSNAVWYWHFEPTTGTSETKQVELTMGVDWTGPASFLYRLLLKSQCDKAFQDCTQNLKNMAEKQETQS